MKADELHPLAKLGRENGIRIIESPLLPNNTIVVGTDIYEILRSITIESKEE